MNKIAAASARALAPPALMLDPAAVMTLVSAAAVV